jgi:hypothetical protein
LKVKMDKVGFKLASTSSSESYYNSCKHDYNVYTVMYVESFITFIGLQSRDHKSVRIWDSSNLLAEEYIRDCTFSQRVHRGLSLLSTLPIPSL